MQLVAQNEISKNLPGRPMGGPATTVNGVDNNGGLTVDDLTAIVQKVRQPEWESGSQYFNYNDTFTARQVDINLTYSKRYE